MSESTGGLENTQLSSQQRRCDNCFSLPHSQFLLGLQSFSVDDRSPAGCTYSVLEGHRKLVERLQQQRSNQQKTRQQPETSLQQRIPGRPCGLPPRQAHRQQRERWRDQQRQQQACCRESQAKVSGYIDVPMLPVRLLPTPLSSIAPPPLNANEETELSTWAEGQQQRPPQLPQKDFEDAKVGEIEKVHTAAPPRQAERSPAGPVVAEPAAVEQQQKQPPVRRHLLGWEGRVHGAGTRARHVPAAATTQSRRKDEVEESARHQVAGRFQVIRKLRHPHLCVYTHMLRKGRRIYVVSEYWSLSLADLLNQQLQSSTEVAVNTSISPHSCSSSAISLNDSTGGESSTESETSRSSITNFIASASNKRCNDVGDSCCCSSTEKRTSCSGCGELLPLMPETFLRRVVRQTLSALEYLNSHGIVHSRLSLSAIRFDAEGNVRVADWGLQYLTAHGRCSPHTQVHPPLPFISPETLLLGPAAAAATPPPPAALSAAVVSATPAVHTASSTSVSAAATCFTAGAAPTDVLPGCSSGGHVAASGTTRPDMPAAPETVAAPDSAAPPVTAATPETAAAPETATAASDTSAYDVGMATDSCLHSSSTGDVFSVGIILLHLLQGPPRTPMPQELLEHLQRETAQQQHEEVLLTRGKQATKEAKREQQHGHQMRGCRKDNAYEEQRKQAKDQQKTLTFSEDSLLQQKQQQLAPERQQKGNQREQEAIVVRQQQGCKKNEKEQNPEEEGKDKTSSIHGKLGLAEEERTSTPSVQGRHMYRSSSEKGRDEEKEEEAPYSGGTSMLYWDEWEGYERPRITKRSSQAYPCSSSPTCSMQSEVDEDDTLQKAACCLRLLRHIERVALLLLYIHCGYEGIQGSLSFLASAWQQKETRTCLQDKLSDRYTDKKEAAVEMFDAHATAKRDDAHLAITAANEGTANLDGGVLSVTSGGTATIGSCIGQGLKQFWRQQQQLLLDSMRDLLRGPCSANFQSDNMYCMLIKLIFQHRGAETLHQSLQKRQALKPRHVQEVLQMPTGGFLSILSDDRRKAARLLVQQQQEDVEELTWQQTTPATAHLPSNSDQRSSMTSPFKEPHSCMRYKEAEDVLLELVLSAAVDWLSGTHTWPSNLHSLRYNNITTAAGGGDDGSADCFLGDRLPATEVGMQTSAAALRGVNKRNESITTAARLEPAAGTAGRVSQELRDFLRLCLAVSPSDRPTPAEALNSAWLQQLHDTTTAATMQQKLFNRNEEPQQRVCRCCPSLGVRNIIRAKKKEEIIWCPARTAPAVTLLQQLQTDGTQRGG